MIYESVQLIVDQLSAYLIAQNIDATITKPVTMDSVARIHDEGATGLTDKMIVSMVSISQETSLKNLPNYRKDGMQTEYRNQPVYANLYIIIGANFPDSYNKALNYLSHTVRFFQGKSVFTHLDSPSTVTDSMGEFKIILDLFSPTFEQLNHLWGTLGGKQIPHVCYKLRLVELERANTQEVRGLIEQIQIVD